MKVKIYAKSAVDLHAKLGAYALFFDGLNETFKKAARFKGKVQTLTQADCAAFTNAMYFLSSMACATELTEIEVITDSGKVVAFLEVYKAEKYCQDLADNWRTCSRPIFVNLQRLTFRKLSYKPQAGDPDSLRLADCFARAKGELSIHRNMLD